MRENNSLDMFTPEDAENEEDVHASDPSILTGIVVSDSDWTAETILNQLRKGNIQLNPRFQRRDAWDDERKSRFIESLILGLPIPQLVLAELQQKKGQYLVIDGKQRLLSLLKFAGESPDPLRLKGLKLRRDLNGLTFKELSQNSDDLSAFENAIMRTTAIKGWADEEVLYLVFHRLNSGSVPLSPQELRHVLHPGSFIDFAFDYTETNPVLIDLLGRDGKPDFRMRDVEMLIRFFAFKLYGASYQGDLKKFLDETTEKLNNDWKFQEGNIRKCAESCVQAIIATEKIFGDDAFSKWSAKGFEPRFNRAVFDIMCLYFSRDDIAEASVKNAIEVRNAFIELCRDDVDFLRSLESTTKSVGSTYTRIFKWGKAIAEITGISPKELEMVPAKFGK